MNTGIYGTQINQRMGGNTGMIVNCYCTTYESIIGTSSQLVSPLARDIRGLHLHPSASSPRAPAILNPSHALRFAYLRISTVVMICPGSSHST